MQLDLFDGASYVPVRERPNDIREAAAIAYHRANPHVLHELARIALLVKRTGRKHWGIQAALEVVRYNAAITTDHRTYKLNNNHAAFYGRWLMDAVPELAGFFRTRTLGRVPQRYFE